MLTTTVTAPRPKQETPTVVATPAAVDKTGQIAPNLNALPDGGPPIGPDQWVPHPGHMSRREFIHSLNPLQHMPVVGMIYRVVTGDEIPAPMSIAGSIISSFIFGGPAGVLGSIALNFAEELYRIGPAYPGHQLKVGDYSYGSETPTALPSGPPPKAIYADGSGGLPSWVNGDLTQYDITKDAIQVTQSGDATTRHAAAAAAYQQAMTNVQAGNFIPAGNG